MFTTTIIQPRPVLELPQKANLRIRTPSILSRYRHLILEYNQRKREEFEAKFRKQFRNSVKDYKLKTI